MDHIPDEDAPAAARRRSGRSGLTPNSTRCSARLTAGGDVPGRGAASAAWAPPTRPGRKPGSRCLGRSAGWAGGCVRPAQMGVGAREGGGVTGSGVFVGREAELSSLRASLHGGARLLLVAGDAGIGKTRFVAEGLRDADAERRLSVCGACLPLAERLP